MISIMDIVSHVLSLIFTGRLMSKFNRQNPSLLEDLFQGTIDKATKNIANIGQRHHGDEMRHM